MCTFVSVPVSACAFANILVYIHFYVTKLFLLLANTQHLFLFLFKSTKKKKINLAMKANYLCNKKGEGVMMMLLIE